MTVKTMVVTMTTTPLAGPGPGAGDIWALEAGSRTRRQMPRELRQPEEPAGEGGLLDGAQRASPGATIKKEGKVQPSKWNLG